MTEPSSPAGKASRRGVFTLLGVIVLLLCWYLAADRLTPYTSQARIQAFVIPISAEVSGQIQKVYVKDNQRVAPGDPLFELDPEPYDIALAKARSDYETVLSSVKANNETIAAAKAGLQAATAAYQNAAKDAERQERLYREDPGTISVRRLEVAQATRETARSQMAAAAADLRRATEAAGIAGENNSQLLSARSAVRKAELDRKNTVVIATNPGLVTDLRTDIGQFLGAGAPVMTLVAINDVWISADMTENNIGNVKPGAEVAILLDSMPGHIFKGQVRSIGYGVSAAQSQPAGVLPTVDNNRDWLRQAQRFPVKIAFSKDDLPPVEGLRVGGQVDVLVYANGSGLMSFLGSIYIRFMSLFSYIY
ncbi:MULTISPECIES: HlyD family secretion protein [Buttiauxella]|jgi:multidrug resistance efflux pump|uniref:Membrane fusion component of a tripartite multidrug resistance system n=1 Tax=Buttiauxella ferragutiae ATCC 51602 TaxID=1354252 RepID=A0ABX2W273_9ENTR|nr:MULTISPECIES: HlyD family secretion protein [Buttiauxella]AYN27199.1 HlyD family secretion protein [Buttiauxella sp. 3AFRM03]MCE0825046.1 HlyD family secretion protein [Buttiauxella ferragutiae]OAT24598.1 membrane fusion component of a tripartite multidrug resistance system [Buttiauxella ferragutiae ATCC 51602]TDN51851.1 multidrug resistance efflux pump [Buttiauxella sp. JUb87]UNK60296.1 HlyD family secretion protein [Buttiauxella ferragutiae]